MKSMTGYGRGESSGGGFKVTTEISAVNRRQAEIAVSLPRELEALEPKLRDEVNRVIARGRVSLRVNLHAADAASPRHLRLDLPLARAYAKELRRLAEELHLDGGVTLEALLRAPGVLQTDDSLEDPEVYWALVSASLQKALSALLKMREREGKHLATDLKDRIALMKRAVEKIRNLAPGVSIRYRDQLRERLTAAGLPIPADDERLLKELALFADRSDISEELTRLQSHFKQFDDCLKSKEPVGRTLDFLAQEMNREINTIGSKANDAAISREVVILKTELEKFREQVQNVE